MSSNVFIQEYLVITEDDVKRILQSKDTYLNSIYEKMDTIHKEMNRTDDLMKMVSLRRSNLSDMPKGKNGHNDLSAVYEKYITALEKRDTEYADFFESLQLEELSIQRVWLCFQALNEPYYGILKRLYVDGELYATVESESGVSIRVFEERRKTAIRMIMELYASDQTEANLIMLRRSMEKERLLKGNFHKKSNKPTGQISMSEWMESLTIEENT